MIHKIEKDQIVDKLSIVVAERVVGDSYKKMIYNIFLNKFIITYKITSNNETVENEHCTMSINIARDTYNLIAI